MIALDAHSANSLNEKSEVLIKGRPIDSAEIASIVDALNNVLTVIGGYTMLVENELTAGDPYERDIAEINASLSRAAEITRRLSVLAEEPDAAVSR